MRLNKLVLLEFADGGKLQAGRVGVRADDLKASVFRIEQTSDAECQDARPVPRQVVFAALGNFIVPIISLLNFCEPVGLQ